MATTTFDREKFGKDIAFGVEQTALCFATDFIDPYVGAKIQKRLGPHIVEGKELKYAFIGEVAGDFTALFSFLAVQRFFPQITDGIKSLVKATCAPIYDRIGRKSISQWAKSNNVAKDSAEYAAKLNEWKEFQYDNIAKSSIVAAGSIGFNVGTQKLMGNAHKVWVITVAKVAGAAITMAAMLGLRFVIPKTTQGLDDELNDRYISPIIRWSQKLLGGKVNEKPNKMAKAMEQETLDPLGISEKIYNRHGEKILQRREAAAAHAPSPAP